jgi:hypothetical protein
MEQPDQELLRRTLLAIVKRIEGGGTTPVMMGDRADQISDASGPPVVVILLGQAGPTDNRVSDNQDSHEAKPGAGSNTPHPGFERFQISGAHETDVPKNCFMEPDRICVNSGACEMLGH